MIKIPETVYSLNDQCFTGFNKQPGVLTLGWFNGNLYWVLVYPGWDKFYKPYRGARTIDVYS